MGTKIKIKDTDTVFDLPRGASIPQENSVVFLTLKGERDEKAYAIYLIEHSYDLNRALPLGDCIITLVEIKPKKSKKSAVSEE